MVDRQQDGRLLVIEDDPDERDCLSGCLEQLGYGVVRVADGRQALALLAPEDSGDGSAQTFGLVLFGKHVPDTEVRQVLAQVKSDRTLCHLSAIAVTEADRVDQAVRAVEMGAEDCLLLPCNPVLWRARLDTHLEKSRLCAQMGGYAGLLKLEHDMQIGRQIQTDFLPDESHLPQPKGWQIAARFHAAREVAGDFYDAFSLSGGKVGLVIGDVCDKGVGPALFMALSRSLIRAFAEQHRPLSWMDSLTDTRSARAQDSGARRKRRKMLLSAGTSALLAVELTNKYIADNHIDMNMFATLFFGVLDPNTGVLTYVNGGHDPPAIVDPGGVVKARLPTTGPAVGMLPDMDFDIQQTTLAPGDLLMAFSDGAPDARNPAGERFTVDRLLSLLEGPISSVGDLLDRIEAALYTHIADADQFDDITMLAAWRVPT
jgi:serine phosphatase RsbU (regulator of sigma subunit)/CheY-like chemotaxis protein